MDGDAQSILDGASIEEREHYHELMRHDPIAGDVFLRALFLRQEATAGDEQNVDHG